MDSGPLYCAHGLCALLLELFSSFLGLAKSMQIESSQLSMFTIFRDWRIVLHASRFITTDSGAVTSAPEKRMKKKEEDKRNGNRSRLQSSIDPAPVLATTPLSCSASICCSAVRGYRLHLRQLLFLHFLLFEMFERVKFITKYSPHRIPYVSAVVQRQEKCLYTAC